MRFLHIRYYHGEGHINHLLDGQYACTKGGKTVAYDVDDDEIIFAEARCSDRDNYCRKTGRTIAEGRFNAGKTRTLAYMNPQENPIEVILRNLGDW